MSVYFKKHKIPVVFDAINENLVKSISGKWTCNSSGIISSSSEHDGAVYDVKLHEIIMEADKKRKCNTNAREFRDSDAINAGEQCKNNVILHINRMGLDNRIENLIYDTKKKNITKNTKKKQRYVVLPENSGISSNELPTYVWYNKPEGTHGERFVISVGDVFWKSTSSRKVSLRFKLEEAKVFLRSLKQEKPDLFESFSMNGDYNGAGNKLLESFYDIIYKAGFLHIKKIILPCATEQYLHPRQLETMLEEKIFNDSGVFHRGINDGKNTIKLLPNGKNSKITSLPKNCYYRPQTAGRGDFFIVKNHPKRACSWSTSTSKYISTNDKYNQLLEFVASLGGSPFAF